MTMNDTAHNVAATPAVAVAGITLFGYPISDVVQVLAGTWLLMQMIWWVYTKIKKAHDDNQEGRLNRGAGVAARDGREDAS